jgi:uncharacterized protein
VDRLAVLDVHGQPLPGGHFFAETQPDETLRTPAHGGQASMKSQTPRTVCWIPTWSPNHVGHGMEQATLMADSADSVLLAFDEDGAPFRLTYRLRWDHRGRLLTADLDARKEGQTSTLALRSDAEGRWRSAQGERLDDLDGCIDIDIWPTPLTNSLPLWRSQFDIGERREFRMAWVAAPALTVQAKAQAYTRVAEDLFLFESLDGSGFKAELRIDQDGIVTDYPGLFRRVWSSAGGP